MAERRCLNTALATLVKYVVEHYNSGKKSFDSILVAESIFSVRQSDKFARCTLIFK